MRKIIVVLEIDVDDLPMHQRLELAEDSDTPEDMLPKLEHYDSPLGAIEVACVLQGVASDGANEMLFEGSDTFVRFTECKIVAANWR
jgi:hypothetical protein